MQMANPMRTQMRLFCRLSVGLGLIGVVSCSAVDDGSRGTVESAPGRLQPTLITTTAASASPQTPAGPQDVVAWPCDARPEYRFADRPSHALSQHVPDRICREDSECGDGFCDRGRCAPIWEDRYGQRCSMTCQCQPFLCIEGRCRSCLHHTDCVVHVSASVCGKDPLVTSVAIANNCGVLGTRETHLPAEPVRSPPPATP